VERHRQPRRHLSSSRSILDALAFLSVEHHALTEMLANTAGMVEP
jgi:hypothetical protein